MSKLSFQFNLIVDTETGDFSVVNVESGEVKTTKVTKPKSTTTKKTVSSDVPILTLESNKCCLNQAAVDLMSIEVGDKIDIKYSKQDGKIVPIIGTDEAFSTQSGNKFCKNGSFAFRGAKNEELAKYGSEFKLIADPNTSGIFILDDPNVEIKAVETADIPDDLLAPELEDDLDSLMVDTDTTEVSGFQFTL